MGWWPGLRLLAGLGWLGYLLFRASRKEEGAARVQQGMALMQDDLSKVAEAIHLGRRAMHVIQVNIIFALAVKAVFLVLALLGYTSLWLAILADTGATVLVTMNALRLLAAPPT